MMMIIVTIMIIIIIIIIMIIKITIKNEKLMKTTDEECKREYVREYKRRIRLILISKLNGKNKIKVINSWAIAILRYDVGVLEWRVDELKELNGKTG